MRIGRIDVDVRALRSRVGRRVFVVFLAGALVPVAAFAFFGYEQVRSQLESDAYLAVGREAKTAGMSILERLMITEVNLGILARDSESEPYELPGILSHRFETGTPAPRDRTSTLRIEGSDDDPRLEMRLWHAATGRWIVAELDPEFVFVPLRRRADERYWVETKEGRLLFVAPHDPLTLRAVSARRRATTRQHFQLEVGAESHLATTWPLFLGGTIDAEDWQVGMSRSRDAVLRPLKDFESMFPLVAVATVALVSLLTLVQLRRTLVPLDALSRFATEVAGGNLAARVSIESRDEFHDLGETFNRMAEEIRGHVSSLARLNEIGQSLSSQRDLERLLDRIVEGATELLHARACALFLDREDGDLDAVRVRILRASGEPDPSPAPGFPRSAARRAASTGHLVRSDSREASSETEADEWRRFAESSGIEVRGSLAIPLRSDQGDAIGALVLLASEDGDVAFSAERVDLGESLASQAAIAIRQERLVNNLRALFEGLIDLTVRAIDEKSAYTGQHCRMVPILTELIAESACGAESGPLKSFQLSPEERYELRIAALLHDCGKVVTPVHVMDKATKLETIFDRIELVRTRFEILRRDLVIRAYEESGASLGEARELQRELAQLDEDLSFLEGANRGGEFMPEGDRTRVSRIGASQSWTAADGSRRPLLDADEVRNLTITRGTLNPDERQIINDHVVATIDLLQELPFPAELRNVPAIAGAHHEHVDGTGYPKGLAGNQLDMQSRILGLADVFEALTASDRPYKPGMPLSQTLQILESLAREGHIDSDLHDLFVREKIYLRYAVEHMDPRQIDSPHWEELEQGTAPWR